MQFLTRGESWNLSKKIKYRYKLEKAYFSSRGILNVKN
jgi:hypothetical protein